MTTPEIHPFIERLAGRLSAPGVLDRRVSQRWRARLRRSMILSALLQRLLRRMELLADIRGEALIWRSASPGVHEDARQPVVPGTYVREQVTTLVERATLLEKMTLPRPIAQLGQTAVLGPTTLVGTATSAGRTAPMEYATRVDRPTSTHDASPAVSADTSSVSVETFRAAQRVPGSSGARSTLTDVATFAARRISAERSPAYAAHFASTIQRRYEGGGVSPDAAGGSLRPMRVAAGVVAREHRDASGAMGTSDAVNAATSREGVTLQPETQQTSAQRTPGNSQPHALVFHSDAALEGSVHAEQSPTQSATDPQDSRPGIRADLLSSDAVVAPRSTSVDITAPVSVSTSLPFALRHASRDAFAHADSERTGSDHASAFPAARRLRASASQPSHTQLRSFETQPTMPLTWQEPLAWQGGVAHTALLLHTPATRSSRGAASQTPVGADRSGDLAFRAPGTGDSNSIGADYSAMANAHLNSPPTLRQPKPTSIEASEIEREFEKLLGRLVMQLELKGRRGGSSWR